MKVVIYEYKQMVRAGQIMRKIKAKGAKNFRLLSELADILDSGTPGDYTENKKEASNDSNRTPDIQGEGSME